MARKSTNKSDKPDKKKLFFGEHLEIKPAFMQRPKSMEEVMAEAFSKNNLNKGELNATVDLQSTVENPVDLANDKEIKATVDFGATIESNTTVENLLDSNISKELEATVESNTILESNATVENIASLKTPKNESKLSDVDNLLVSSSATVVNNATVVKNSNDIENSATVVDSATVVKETLNLEVIPQRLRADITLLKRLVVVNWQPLPEQENISSNYWYAYSRAWHWIEDNVLPHLDKDSKLTLRHCYRKAFGDPKAKGRFFAGQTLLAQEVGLSKRRIQDVLEIFNLLGWVCKTAHHNRGGYKGTEYQMYLPTEVINYF